MALYALGDLHLSFSNPEKSQERFGKIWKDHEWKAKKNIEKLVKPDDTLVLTGDHSWGNNLVQSQRDLEFIAAFPGRKILLRGNHDHFWKANQTKKLNDIFKGRLYFLQNNFYTYKDYALVGTKGFCFEGPFYVDTRTNMITGYDRDAFEHSKELIERERSRLVTGINAAKEAGFKKFIIFLHYPPTSILETDSTFTRIAEELGVEQVIYSHSHGRERFHDSIHGMHHGVKYSLVSGDYLNFKPIKVLK
ncbi:MAG: metallophosphoesterase [Lachnospiraceae bacterium]|uniref:Metallophosphoesterase n=1 Tax=Candidatus Weimeria bifida TaxID=2599074 RepID=A0A6N7IWX2_9FIRM|nr:metallophosphoesterase [Candidatus Weimeria bifida]RRF96240.1 MAG: metallophosphoesterase [Lachnospiraceae bacterium]